MSCFKRHNRDGREKLPCIESLIHYRVYTRGASTIDVDRLCHVLQIAFAEILDITVKLGDYLFSCSGRQYRFSRTGKHGEALCHVDAMSENIALEDHDLGHLYPDA
ncbi:hypothetical protein HMPREF9946_00939 [Acetobacteraceae bacterium AT-5844]|nr:hypothetical protein HMPREF9946_00939 [Acetobacteraceae bacterium AT-5844]